MNVYTNGTLAPANPPNFTYTNTGNTVTTVTMAIPAPQGTDGYQITQYAGQCGSTPYSIPTAPPGNVGSSNILAQTPVTYADIEPGVANNLNNQIANCPLQTVPCPLGVGAGPGAVLAASVTVAKVQFDPTVPITNPVREQGAFLLPALGTNTIGIPIPLEGLTAGGTVIPGLTTPTNLNGGAGPFPSGVTVTLSENLVGTTGNPAHAKLYLMDAKTGAIAQAGTAPKQSISITEFNALAAADVVPANPALVGDQWVLVMAYDGSGYLGGAGVISETVTASATAANAALPSPITLTITPQSAVWSAGGTGYADLSAPTTGLAPVSWTP